MAMRRKVLAIRDDDMCAFTLWDEIMEVYHPIWHLVRVSFSVIPFVGANLPFKGQPDYAEPIPLSSNSDLVRDLRKNLQDGRIGVSLHGYSHIYRYHKGRWYPEYMWKPATQLIKETLHGKRYLENLLGKQIEVFVPPSNGISKGGVVAVEKARLHLSAVMGRWVDRPVSLSYLRAYMLRWVHRIVTGFPYPHPLHVGNHLELCYYSLTPNASYNKLREALKWCNQVSAPFVVAVHYWELLKHTNLREALCELVHEALDMGYEAALLSECFHEN